MRLTVSAMKRINISKIPLSQYHQSKGNSTLAPFSSTIPKVSVILSVFALLRATL